MSGFTNEGGKSGAGSSGGGSAAGDVRQAFAELPFDQKITTLIQVELDMLGDAAGSVVSAVSKAVDDMARACTEQSKSGKTANDGQAENS
jgi:hypothetical protein